MFGVFGLDALQNCWIYSPSWKKILIYVAVVFWKVYRYKLTSKFISNIYYLGLLFGKNAYSFVAPQSVCTLFSGLYLPVISGLQCLPYFFVPFIVLLFVFIYHLRNLFFSVHTCISLCGVISLGFVILFCLILF